MHQLFLFIDCSIPEVIVVGIFTCVALATWMLVSHVTLYVDTSVEAFYSRQNPIADRFNSQFLNFWGLESHCPYGQINEEMLHGVIANLTQHHADSTTVSVVSKSNGVTGESDGRQVRAANLMLVYVLFGNESFVL